MARHSVGTIRGPFYRITEPRFNASGIHDEITSLAVGRNSYYELAIRSSQQSTTPRKPYGLCALDGVGLRRRVVRSPCHRERPAPAPAPNLVPRRACADRPVRRDQARLRNGGDEFLEEVVRLRHDRNQ